MDKARKQQHNIIVGIGVVISAGAFAALSVYSASQLLILLTALGILIGFSLLGQSLYGFWRTHLSPLVIAISLLVLAVYAALFYSMRICSERMAELAKKLGVSGTLLVLGMALVGILVAFFFVSLAIALFLSLTVVLSPEQERGDYAVLATSLSRGKLLVILLTAVATIGICSKSSPLYPFNDWVDANCFLTVGKSMLHGMVPYRDLFEQKGPLLYMLHALAALVSETSFLGVYFLEVVACTAFLFLGYRIIRLYWRTASVLVVPFLAALVYTVPSFMHGDSAEELCLPLFAFALYVGLKGIKNGQLPTNVECLFVGITSAGVLWIKYSLLGFYAGWILVPVCLLLKTGRIKKLLGMIGCILLGVVITTIPILLYFARNGALGDLWIVYFYDNIFLYSSSTSEIALLSLIRSMARGVKSIAGTNFVIPIFLFLAGIALGDKENRWQRRFVLLTFLGTFLLVYSGGRSYTYYAFIFGAFAPLGMMALGKTTQKYRRLLLHRRRGQGLSRLVACAGSLLLAFLLCGNTYMLRYDKSDLVQYQFAEIIAEKEEATLLNYGFLDGGFYTVTGIVPDCKYFYLSNLVTEEMLTQQQAYIDEGITDFVVTRNMEIDSEYYTCVAVSTGYNGEGTYTYYLWEHR